jgi:hypothetical protein
VYTAATGSPYTGSTSTVEPLTIYQGPSVTSVSPTNGATGVNKNNLSIVITFNEALDPTTINSLTILLVDSSGNTVNATVSYDPTTHAVTIKPSNQLSNKSTYQVVVKGGSGGVKDTARNQLVGNQPNGDFDSTFTTN